MTTTRRNTAAKGRKLDAQRHRADVGDDPATMTDNDLWAAVYRLQGKNREGRYSERISALCAEQSNRREATR